MNKFDCLYIVNKRAKQYLNNNGEKNQVRGKCLYKLKHRCINMWVQDFDKVEKHIIDELPYFCFYFNNMSFHIPADKLIVNINDYEEKILTDFSTSLEHNMKYTERDCLRYLSKNYNLNPNSFIPEKYNEEYYWTYLAF